TKVEKRIRKQFELDNEILYRKGWQEKLEEDLSPYVEDPSSYHPARIHQQDYRSPRERAEFDGQIDFPRPDSPSALELENLEKTRQVVVPRTFVPLIFYHTHDSALTGGHLSRDRVRDKIKDRFWWEDWSKDLEAFSTGCSLCTHRKKPNKSPIQ